MHWAKSPCCLVGHVRGQMRVEYSLHLTHRHGPGRQNLDGSSQASYSQSHMRFAEQCADRSAVYESHRNSHMDKTAVEEQTVAPDQVHSDSTLRIRIVCTSLVLLIL